MKKVVIISGEQGSGKTTFAELSAKTGTHSLIPAELFDKGREKYFNEGKKDLIIDPVFDMQQVEYVSNWITDNMHRFDTVYVICNPISFAGRMRKNLEMDFKNFNCRVFRVLVTK